MRLSKRTERMFRIVKLIGIACVMKRDAVTIMLNGKFIGVKEKTNVYILSKKFVCGDTASATLKITAIGVYKAEINGARVGDALSYAGVDVAQ